MAKKSSRRSRQDYLLLIVHLVIIALFCSAIAFVPSHPPHDPDEAYIVNAVRDLGTDWFQAPSLILQAHLLSQVDYYLLSQVVTVTIGVLRVVGALFMIASFTSSGSHTPMRSSAEDHYWCSSFF